MALKIECFMCDSELDEPGALVFSPPTKTGRVRKRHLCVGCSELLEKYFARIKREAKWRMSEVQR